MLIAPGYKTGRSARHVFFRFWKGYFECWSHRDWPRHDRVLFTTTFLNSLDFYQRKVNLAEVFKEIVAFLSTRNKNFRITLRGKNNHARVCSLHNKFLRSELLETFSFLNNNVIFHIST